MKFMTSHKEVQCLKGQRCNKSLPIQVERMRAFQELIKHMQSISALAMHVPREIPFLYLSIKNVVVNVVLVKENVNILFPVYYVS